MKLITKISKSESGRQGECRDGEIVTLSSWLSSEDLDFAVKRGFSPCNIFKIKAGNKSLPIGHHLSGYMAYEGTVVTI